MNKKELYIKTWETIAAHYTSFILEKGDATVKITKGARIVVKCTFYYENVYKEYIVRYDWNYNVISIETKIIPL